jgi:hypothetical protein
VGLNLSSLRGEVFPGIVIQTCSPSYQGGRSRRIINSRPAWTKLVRLYFKDKKKKIKRDVLRRITYRPDKVLLCFLIFFFLFVGTGV